MHVSSSIVADTLLQGCELSPPQQPEDAIHLKSTCQDPASQPYLSTEINALMPSWLTDYRVHSYPSKDDAPPPLLRGACHQVTPPHPPHCVHVGLCTTMYLEKCMPCKELILDLMATPKNTQQSTLTLQFSLLLELDTAFQVGLHPGVYPILFWQLCIRLHRWVLCSNTNGAVRSDTVHRAGPPDFRD